MRAERVSFVAVAIGAAVLGAAIGMGSPVAAIALTLAFVGVLWLFRGKPEHLVWLPLALVLIAPWQRIQPFRSEFLLYPVAWAIVAVCAVLLLRERFVVASTPAAVVGLFVAGWALLGFALGHGAAVQTGRWLMTWILGFLFASIALTRGAGKAIVAKAWFPAAALGAYVSLELALRRNPIYGGLITVVRDQGFLQYARFRPNGTLGHPLATADMLGLLIVLTIAGWRLGRVGSTRALLGASLGAIGLIATGARGALIVTVLAVAAAILIEWRPTMRENLIAVGVVGLSGLVVMVMLPIIEARFSGALGTSSFAQRVASLAAASSVIRSSPLFGEGAGMANIAMLRQGFINFSYETEYAGLLIGLGFPGMIAAIGMPVLTLRRVFSHHTPRVWRPLGVAVVVYGLGIIGTHNVFDWWLGPILYWLCVILPETVAAEEPLPTEVPAHADNS